MTADRENQFAQVTRMSQEKRALSDRRAQARRVSEQVEISRQIAARTPLPKPKALENANGPSLAADLEVNGDNALDLDAEDIEDIEADDDDAKVDRSA